MVKPMSCKKHKPIRFRKLTASGDWTIPNLSGSSHCFDGRSGERPLCFSAIVPKHSSRLLFFQCNWCDQGWGAREGRILVVAQVRPDYLDSRLKALPFAGGTIVAVSPMVKHSKSMLRLSFLPVRNKVYQLWCVVGGGGYNTLKIENMKLQRLSLRNNLPCWRQKFQNAQTADPDDSLDFAALPCNQKQVVAEFLPISDAVHMMQTCKSIKAELALSSVSTQFIVKDTASTPSCFAVYVPTGDARLHSITMQCSIINREYWINSRAQACIVSHPRPLSKGSTSFAKRIQHLSFQQGRIVAKSAVAKTIKSSFTMTWIPRSDEVYQIWLLSKDAAGCASFLELNSLTMHTLGFGNVAASFEASYTGFAMEGKRMGNRLASMHARGGIGQLMHRSSDQIGSFRRSTTLAEAASDSEESL